MKRIATLDGWRAIAILLVLADHARAALHLDPGAGGTTGQHGVALFFVLSGFLITSRLASEKQSTGTINLRRFYLRRFFRLMPAAWVYLCFAFVGALLSKDRAAGMIDCGAAFLFFRNYSYLVAPNVWLTGHFWTLSIEEQFYIVWPSIMVLLSMRFSRWVALILALMVMAYRFTQWNALQSLPIERTLGTHLRADALLAGCAAALFLPSFRKYLRDWMVLPLAASFVFCMAHYHVLVPLYESVIIALLLAITSSSNSKAFTIFDWKPLAFVGTISYSLYLWQQPFIAIGFNGPSYFFLSVVTLPCVAMGSYFLIEKPFIERSHGKRFATSEHSTGTAA